MPLLRKRKLRPHFVRFLFRQLENPELDAETRARIASALDDPKIVEKLNTFTFGQLKRDGKLESPEIAGMSEVSAMVVEGAFLDWLFATFKEYWPQILALLLKLLGL